MKAVILAGGQGKRLIPLTLDRPKPMVELDGKPIIYRQIQWLKKSGIDSFVILASHMKEKLVNYLGNGSKFGVDIEFVFDTGSYGTGGALKNAEKLLKDEKSFMMANGDIITDMDIKKLRLNKTITAMSLVKLRSSYGIVESDNGKIKRFREKPILGNYWINAGIYLMTPQIFDYLPKRGDIEKTAFPELAKKDLLSGVKYSNCYWISIDSLKDVDQASQAIHNKIVKM
jgi:NDP-sugar pyrophosphorylase family protein